MVVILHARQHAHGFSNRYFYLPRKIGKYHQLSFAFACERVANDAEIIFFVFDVLPVRSLEAKFLEPDLPRC